jgi:hypothetical protein
LENVAHVTVSTVEVTRELSFQLLHEFGQISIGRRDDRVEVVPHFSSREDFDAVRLFLLDCSREESTSVL